MMHNQNFQLCNNLLVQNSNSTVRHCKLVSIMEIGGHDPTYLKKEKEKYKSTVIPLSKKKKN